MMVADSRSGKTLEWGDLRLHSIDMHFHAGTERPAPYSAGDFLSYAVATGRRVIGVTDHFGRYLGGSRKPLNHYPGTMDGYRTFRDEVRSAADDFPEALVLFGPELGASFLLSDQASLALAEPGVDFFIAEPAGTGEETSLGEILIHSVESIAYGEREYGRPGFLGHPLRSLVNSYVGKGGPGPKMPVNGPLPPLSSSPDPTSEVSELFDVDIRGLARTLRDRKVSIELNESSWGRIMGMNHESFAERFIFFFRSLREMGASFILGSDLHNAEHGAPTPFVLARMLDIEVGNMAFLEHWLGPPGT